jgi:phosphoglycolate phosphatase
MRDGFRLLVFDWDGTVMDSLASIVACTQAAFADLGLEARSDDSIRRAIGMGLRDSMELFFPGRGHQVYEPLVERYRHHWLASYKDLSTPFPGAAAAVARLHGAGYLLGVATAKSRRGLDRELATTGLGRYFHASRTVDEAPPKPDPRMLRDLMAELAARPAETLMIGDTTYDLEMARHAGTAAVGVCCGSHAREELAGCSPLACLADVAAVADWLAARRAAASSPGA